jgi:DNA polymerase III alpha subunit
MTQHYVDRKHGREEVGRIPIDESLEEILIRNIWCYRVSRAVHDELLKNWQDLTFRRQTTLRKAIGKKQVSLDDKSKKLFYKRVPRAKERLAKKRQKKSLVGLKNPVDMPLTNHTLFLML